ncbi:MAG: NAD(+) diphosphatase [Alphaproteobacteria bacterium HGW-Alphaproteobacteria-6]|nr:MAG: NAD(+) diphosphatase [Alphaproteobacteria bacterium HGW-Alphaproteobacteria-6]
MDQSRAVTFGDSGLDRAAWMRGKADLLARHLAEGRAAVLPLWRGKPLFQGAAAVWLAPGHPLLAGDDGLSVFLGLQDGQALFARDLSAWQPPADATLPGTGFFDPTEQRHPDLPEDHAFAELRARMAVIGARDGELAATARALFCWHQSHRFCSACGVASEPAEAGWQRRCPACGTSHFPRTDPVVIMLVTRANRVLLGRSPGWPEGMYSLLAGFMEPGETIEAAVRREVAEETGVTVGRVRYLASQPWPYPASLMLGCAAEAESEAITLDPVELEAALWVTREEMVTVFAGSHPAIRPPRKGAIAAFILANWLADRLD